MLCNEFMLFYSLHDHVILMNFLKNGIFKIQSMLGNVTVNLFVNILYFQKKLFVFS